MAGVTNNRILVLDDEPGVLDAYRLILDTQSALGVQQPQIVSSRRGGAAQAMAQPVAVAEAVAFEITYAKSGEEALEQVKAQVQQGKPFAGGFFDVKLGSGIDGIETIKRARQFDPNMLYVMVTAYQDRTVDEIAKLFGEEFSDRWDFLTKPFSSNEILQKARNLLANWDRREKIRQYLSQIETQQRQLVLAERLAAIGTLARGIGHEFGNILNRIIGMAELAAHKNQAAEMKQTLQTIAGASERAGVIVRNLQGLVKMETTRADIDIHEPIRDSLALVEHELKKVSVELVEEFDLKLPKINANKVEIGQVFLNLIINAAHAMETRKGKLTIKTYSEKGRLAIDVTDTGTGITPDNMKRLFEPLFTTKGNKGTGIGLSVSKKIVTNHNGTIDVQSTPDKGTTFHLTFPCK